MKKIIGALIVIGVLAGMPVIASAALDEENIALASNGASVLGGSPINDGVVSGYTGSTGFSWFYWPDSMTIVLPKVYTVDRIKTLLWDGDGRYYQYYLEVSEDGEKWIKVVDKTSGQWKSWQLDTFEPIPAKYIRITGTYNSANEGFYIVELEAYEKDNNENIALASNGAGVIGAPINDGIVSGYTGSTGFSWFYWPDSMTIVLPKVYTVDRIKTLLWDGDGRYYQYYLEVSEDGEKWIKVVDKTSGQWKSWQLDTFEPIPAKYIRITGTYNSANEGFYIVELEAYGSIDSTASNNVIPSLIETSDKKQTSTASNIPTASVNLHGEKTDVALGEDVLLKLSAVNIIGNPTMHVQVIIIPPSGWSVTSSEFAKSGAGQYTTTYELESGGGKDIEVRIVPNQIGDDFQVKGRIIYYFGDDLATREDHTLNLPIMVRAELDDGQKSSDDLEESKTPGFGVLISAIGLVAMYLLNRNKMR